MAHQLKNYERQLWNDFLLRNRDIARKTILRFLGQSISLRGKRFFHFCISLSIHVCIVRSRRHESLLHVITDERSKVGLSRTFRISHSFDRSTRLAILTIRFHIYTSTRIMFSDQVGHCSTPHTILANRVIIESRINMRGNQSSVMSIVFQNATVCAVVRNHRQKFVTYETFPPPPRFLWNSKEIFSTFQRLFHSLFRALKLGEQCSWIWILGGKKKKKLGFLRPSACPSFYRRYQRALTMKTED